MKNQAQTPNSNRGFNAHFLCIAPLAQPLVTDRVITSIDSVRIKYTYPRTITNPETYERFDTINYLLEQLTSVSRWMDGKYDSRMMESGFRMGNYRYTVHYTLPDNNAFAVLLGRFNTAEKSEGQAFDSARRITYDVVMDFNPNKIPSDVWEEIAAILSPLALQTTIQRFDLAMDFPFFGVTSSLYNVPVLSIPDSLTPKVQLQSISVNAPNMVQSSFMTKVQTWDSLNLTSAVAKLQLTPKGLNLSKICFPLSQLLPPLHCLSTFPTFLFLCRRLFYTPICMNSVKRLFTPIPGANTKA